MQNNAVLSPLFPAFPGHSENEAIWQYGNIERNIAERGDQIVVKIVVTTMKLTTVTTHVQLLNTLHTSSFSFLHVYSKNQF